MEKILSIIVPTYNMEKYLHRALDSFIIPDNEECLEVLIINDGSKDKSVEIANKYIKNYPEIFRLIDKENGNYGSCVNKGIELATGRFLRICDADDWYDSDALRKFLEILQSIPDEVDAVFSLFSQINMEGKILSSQPDYIYGEGHIIDFSCLKMKDGIGLSMHCLTYRTDLLRRINLKLQHGISYTDLEYVFYPLAYVKKVIFTNLSIYQYLRGREGQTVSLESQLRSIEHFYKVSSRMMNAYRDLIGSVSEEVLANLRHTLVWVTFQYFYLVLLYSERNDISMAKLKGLYSTAKGCDKRIFREMRDVSIIPFLSLWKYTGLFFGQFPFVRTIVSLRRK